MATPLYHLINVNVTQRMDTINIKFLLMTMNQGLENQLISAIGMMELFKIRNIVLFLFNDVLR